MGHILEWHHQRQLMSANSVVMMQPCYDFRQSVSVIEGGAEPSCKLLFFKEQSLLSLLPTLSHCDETAWKRITTFLSMHFQPPSLLSIQLPHQPQPHWLPASSPLNPLLKASKCQFCLVPQLLWLVSTLAPSAACRPSLQSDLETGHSWRRRWSVRGFSGSTQTDRWSAETCQSSAVRRNHAECLRYSSQERIQKFLRLPGSCCVQETTLLFWFEHPGATTKVSSVLHHSGCYAAHLKKLVTPHCNKKWNVDNEQWIPTVNYFMVCVCVLQVRTDQDEEVKKLTQLRDSLRLLLQVEGKEVRLFRTLHSGWYTLKNP